MPDPLNVSVDLSHHNGNVDLAQAQAAGIVGVIHKATQGTGLMYAANRAKAENSGLLCGAYHFGTGAGGVAQADYFLQEAQPGPQDLVVLDLETNTQGPSMTLDQARDLSIALTTVWEGSPGSIPVSTSRGCSAQTQIRFWPTAGSGWPNIIRRLSCP